MNSPGLEGSTPVRPADRLVQVASWLRYNGDVAGARALLEEASRLDPTNPRVMAQRQPIDARPSDAMPPELEVEEVALEAPEDAIASEVLAPDFFLTLRQADGTTRRFGLVRELTLGSRPGALALPGAAGAPAVATLLVKEGRVTVRDEGSAVGVYGEIADEAALVPGGRLLVGGRELRMNTRPNGACVLEELDASSAVQRAFVLREPIFTVGREGCELSYPTDDTLAAVHCEITPGPWATFVRDRSEGKGTFLRVPPGGTQRVRPGQRLRVGTAWLTLEPATRSPR